MDLSSEEKKNAVPGTSRFNSNFESPFSPNEDLQIQQIRDVVDPRTTTSIQGNLWSLIWKVKPVENYESQGKTKQYQHIFLVDESGSMKATNYTSNPCIKEGAFVMMRNFLVQDDTIKITTVTQIYQGARRPIPEGSLQKAEVLFNKLLPREIKSIEEALDEPVGTMFHIKAKVIKTLTVTTRNVKGESTPYREIRLRDTTGTATLSCWRDLAQLDIEEGNVVQFRNLLVSKYNHKKRFSTADKGLAKTSIEFKLDEEFSLAVDSDDDEEMKEEPAVHWISGQISGIGKINVYRCCKNRLCYGKKLNADNKCEKCRLVHKGDSYDTGMATTLIVTNKKKDVTHLTVFKKYLQEIWEKLSHETFPLHNTQFLTDSFLQQEVCFEYLKNDNNIMTALRMKSQVHPI